MCGGRGEGRGGEGRGGLEEGRVRKGREWEGEVRGDGEEGRACRINNSYYLSG